MQRSPIQIKCRQAFALLKGVGGRRGWGPGEGAEGVQLYIRSVKASPPRNGVRLHLTFLRLASLVGIGHEIATPFFPPPGKNREDIILVRLKNRDT